MRGDRSYGTICERFTLDELFRVRGLVRSAGDRAGLRPTRTNNLVAAVHEVAVNAVRYAGGEGQITIAESPDGVYVEVRDTGPGLPPRLTYRLPAPSVLGGRGLWVARHLCRQLTISSSKRGVVVGLFTPIGSGRDDA